MTGTEETAALEHHASRIRVDGYTVLENVFPVPWLAEVRESPGDLFAHAGLYEHPGLLALAEAVLGPDPVLTYLAYDPGLPGRGDDTVHSDAAPLFPEARVVTPAFGLVANIPLADVTEGNGPTELWPGGTHHAASRVEIPRLAASMLSLRVTPAAGSVLVRDLRTWHRGTANPGPDPRPMVTLVYSRPWYRLTVVPPISLPRAQFDGLSARGKALLRHAVLGDSG